MGVSSPRDDRAERNLGVASVPLSTVIPLVGNAHLQQSPISDFYNLCPIINMMTYHSIFCRVKNYSCLITLGVSPLVISKYIGEKLGFPVTGLSVICLTEKEKVKFILWRLDLPHRLLVKNSFLQTKCQWESTQHNVISTLNVFVACLWITHFAEKQTHFRN